MRVFDHDRLRTARLDLAMTQDDAARALGIAPRTYRRYESGRVNDPKRGFRVRHADRQNIVLTMCAVFEVDESELIREEEAPPAVPGFTVSVTIPDPNVLGRILTALRELAPEAAVAVAAA